MLSFVPFVVSGALAGALSGADRLSASWATLADRLGISEKEISKGLGHVDTSIAGKFYISYDWTKVDRANRTVIDHIASLASK